MKWPWRQIYQNNDRALGVINLAAEKAGWGQPLPEGQGRGNRQSHPAYPDQTGRFDRINAALQALNLRGCWYTLCLPGKIDAEWR